MPSLTPLIEPFAQAFLRIASDVVVRRHLELIVEGREHLPRRGPALLVARHVHHLYDGCVFLSQFPRTTHILVGLDWIGGGLERSAVEFACRVARWPVVLRTREVDRRAGAFATPGASAYSPQEATRYLRSATRTALGVLRGGEPLVIFPEAYPNIDPKYTPKPDRDAFLPFRPGYLSFAQLAEKDRHTRVPILPAGFAYTQLSARPDRWRVALRLGEPYALADYPDRERLARLVEARVRELSAPVEVR